MNAYPFLKWVGGKRQIIDKLLIHIPNLFKNYYEPFLGGGALFFTLYNTGQLNNKKIFLSDFNQELIDCYVAIRDDVQSVIYYLKDHYYDHDYYYHIRDLEPNFLSLTERAARTIYLNRTGFNGLYRVNKKGKFNVLFGRYVNPTICDEKNLIAVSSALKDVIILCCSFVEIAYDNIEKHDFIYFDPPYIPISKTSHFVNYNKMGFSWDDQDKLFRIFSLLTKRKAYAMLSNSYIDWVIKKYQEFNQNIIFAKRRVNSRGSKRGPVKELLILNYGE